ncbi:MAG: acyltransferase family protein [Solobacterium sp.]|nr:acyltransferase family protein [Solobacterium sp.]
MENKRIDYLDICKGILIILVVIGHVIQIIDIDKDSYLIKFIYSFHMPAFFMISGYLFNADKWKRKGFKEFLINRINKNLIPYFFFEYLYGFTAVLFSNHAGLNWKGWIMEALLVIKKSLTARPNYVPSWFLITLFFAAILVYWIEGNDRKRIIAGISVLTVISIAGGYFIRSMEEGFVQNLILFNTRIAFSAIFILIGILWRELDFSKLHKTFFTVVCLAVTLLFPFYFERESIYLFSFRFVTPFILTGITGTYLTVALSKRLDFRFLRFLGRESMTIMGTHYSFFALKRLAPGVYYSKYAVPICLAGIIVLNTILIPVFNRFVPFLIGKKELPFLKQLHSE